MLNAVSDAYIPLHPRKSRIATVFTSFSLIPLHSIRIFFHCSPVIFFPFLPTLLLAPFASGFESRQGTRRTRARRRRRQREYGTSQVVRMPSIIFLRAKKHSQKHCGGRKRVLCLDFSFPKWRGITVGHRAHRSARRPHTTKIPTLFQLAVNPPPFSTEKLKLLGNERRKNFTEFSACQPVPTTLLCRNHYRFFLLSFSSILILPSVKELPDCYQHRRRRIFLG